MSVYKIFVHIYNKNTLSKDDEKLKNKKENQSYEKEKSRGWKPYGCTHTHTHTHTHVIYMFV